MIGVSSSVRRGAGVTTFAGAAALITAIPGMPAHSDPGYTSTVHFRWVGSPPNEIREDSLPTGPKVTDQVHNPHRWESQHSTAVPLSRIYIAYAGEKYLLPYRSFRGAPPVTVYFGRPPFTCLSNSLDSVETALSQDISTQITAMMAAGNLLLRPPSQCPTSSKNRLIDLYFRLNCQLASRAPYIGYLDEAEDAFRRRWAGNIERAQFAQGCRANAYGSFRNFVAAEVTRLAQGGQLAQAAALGRDVRALSREPAWAETFRDYALSDIDINAWEISQLVAVQVAAQRTDQNSEAQVANVQLLERAHDPAQGAAFARAQVSVDRVFNDSRQIQAAITRSRASSLSASER